MYDVMTYVDGAFNSCREDRISELNAHERYHNVDDTSGKLGIVVVIEKHGGITRNVKMFSSDIVRLFYLQ